MAVAFQFYLQSEKQIQVGWLENNSHVKFPSELVRCRDATASSEAKSSHIFMQLPYEMTAVCGIDCFACQGEFFAKNPLDVKKIMRMLMTLIFAYLAFFGLGEFEHPNTAHALFPKILSFSEICTKFMHTLVGSIVKSHKDRYTTPNKRT
jgi:hypothetical protein